ncbi:uncharacterized protein DDB_G0271670-like [Zingiber officinale]|uniref:uncharacterized protein DDB_G0271670-like n=1 Tax=Zingiber officinale TaxID=94328 RepID=UPI001C4D4CF2|nr:uncharacterized protein DDB_G0271670-like [Zingiber officinale]
MEEPGSSGGGGSAVSHESLVGEGVASASTAIAARLGEYAEVFGDLEGSCSIPFLDLPSAFDGLDDALSGTLAYSEVFGPSYDESFAEREEASSSDPRKTTEESTSSHQAMLDFKIFSPSHFHGNHMTIAYEEGDSSSSSNSIIFNNLSTQPNVSYSKAGQGIRDGTSSERIHITQILTTSASSLVIGGTADGPHTTLNDSLYNVKHQQKLPTSSSTTSKTSENYSKADQKHSVSRHSVVKNNCVNASYSSSSSSSFTLSGDLSSSDTTDMTVSSVSLRRQPTQVPLTTPSGSKVGFDEIINMSATEASDALVKAMEFAQARLKIAKNSLEKRHQNPQKNKKLGQ